MKRYFSIQNYIPVSIYESISAGMGCEDPPYPFTLVKKAGRPQFKEVCYAASTKCSLPALLVCALSTKGRILAGKRSQSYTRSFLADTGGVKTSTSALALVVPNYLPHTLLGDAIDPGQFRKPLPCFTAGSNVMVPLALDHSFVCDGHALGNASHIQTPYQPIHRFVQVGY
jgi:hypothetical protein